MTPNMSHFLLNYQFLFHWPAIPAYGQHTQSD